jgi:hypothetical protein
VMSTIRVQAGQRVVQQWALPVATDGGPPPVAVYK